jgi:alkylated DNA repair dioxygenase AlkB
MEPLQRNLLGSTLDGAAAVDGEAGFERLLLDEGSWIDVARGWLRGADTVLDRLVEAVPWRQGRRWMYGELVDEPRLSRWYRGDQAPPHPVLAVGRALLTERYYARLSGPGLNYYRDGHDSVGFHRDSELRHLDQTLVAIVTLGAARPFLIRPRGGGPSRDLRPGSGDLLVMGGRCQADWEHCVPKTATVGPRISVTWRWSSGRGTPVRVAPFGRGRSRPARP